MDTYLQLPIEKKNLVTISGFWIVLHPVIWLKNLCGSKNISPEVMDIYLADKNSKMMSQGTGNVSAKTVSTKHCNSINLTITDVSYVPQLRCNLLSVTCLMDKGSKYENLTDKRIKKIRTDNGLEFVNEQLDTYLANSGIFHEKTIPYNSESNGKAERANRVLLERARSLLYKSKLPLKFWAEAINCSTQVSNVTPRKGKVKNPIRNLDRNEINQNTENGVLYDFDINNGPGAIENDNSIPLQTTSSPRTGRIQIPVLELNDVQNQIPVRRSERLKSKLMSVHLVNNVPNSYFEAENSANWKNWKLAMENELDSLDKHKVWEIVQKPAKSKLIKTKWVYSLKQDDAGKNIKYKARLVAAGFNQIKNIDYSESYSPVVNIESFRLLIALAAKLKLNVNFFDVKTAYLYGDLAETVYVLPPPGYEKLIGDDKVCKLKKEYLCCQVIYSQFGLAFHQNDHEARRRFVEWAQNEIAVVPDFHKRILFSDEAHIWLNGYVNKQNCRIWSEANPQVYVETPLHPEKLTVWCALWAGGPLLQKR
ncbi:copia protein [Trichonephila clavipes]|nr:copia protein [Trichonephila clavipes]